MIRRRVSRQDDGQILPLVALFLVILAAVMVLVIDVARVYIAQQQIQNAVNASALAAGQAMPYSATALADADEFGGATGEKNALFGYDVTASTPTVTFECLSHGANYTAPTQTGGPPTCPADLSTNTSGQSYNCEPGSVPVQPVTSPLTTSCNAVVVSETANVKSIFGGLFFPHGWNVSASAIAAARGGGAKPLNIEVILDTTGSMDQDCGETVTGITTNTQANQPDKEDCAKAGARALLETLAPCQTSTCTGAAPSASQGGANWSYPEDEVGVIPIPANTNQYATYEINCSNNSYSGDTDYPQWTDPSTTPGNIPSSDVQHGYEAVGLSSDFSTSADDATLSSTSDLVRSLSWDSCTPASYPDGDYYGLKQIGGHGSYLAGAITDAENVLLAESVSRPGSANVIVIESDGEMTEPTSFSNGTSSDTPCKDAYEAAAAAKTALIAIYAIEYDSNGACGADNTNADKTSQNNDAGSAADASPTTTYDNADWLMEHMATSTSAPYYYDDPGNGTGPSLDADFGAVGLDITSSRLIANCTNAPPAC